MGLLTSQYHLNAIKMVEGHRPWSSSQALTPLQDGVQLCVGLINHEIHGGRGVKDVPIFCCHSVKYPTFQGHCRE